LKIIEKHGIKSERRFLVKNQFGKAIKSPSYSPANIKRELFFQGYQA
jgi:hypothetical protein